LAVQLLPARASHEALVRQFAGIATAAAPAGIAPMPVIPDALAASVHAAELARLLAGWRKRELTAEERAIIGRELGPGAAGSMDAFLAAARVTSKEGRSLSDAAMAVFRKHAP
jgi:hypothetical protein